MHNTRKHRLAYLSKYWRRSWWWRREDKKALRTLDLLALPAVWLLHSSWPSCSRISHRINIPSASPLRSAGSTRCASFVKPAVSVWFSTWKLFRLCNKLLNKRFSIHIINICTPTYDDKRLITIAITFILGTLLVECSLFVTWWTWFWIHFHMNNDMIFLFLNDIQIFEWNEPYSLWCTVY